MSDFDQQSPLDAAPDSASVDAQAGDVPDGAGLSYDENLDGQTPVAGDESIQDDAVGSEVSTDEAPAEVQEFVSPGAAGQQDEAGGEGYGFNF